MLAIAAAFVFAGNLCAAAASEHSGDDTLLLEQYHWRLMRAESRSSERLPAFTPPNSMPLTLRFQGVFLTADGCNMLSERYSLSDQRLIQSKSESDLVTRTLLGCGDRPGLRDGAVLILLNGDPRYRFVSSKEADDAPELELESDAGVKVTFLGVPTGRTRFGDEGELIYLDISSSTIRCKRSELPARDCLQVRQRLGTITQLQSFSVGDDRLVPVGPWQLLYEGIEGLTFDGIYRRCVPVKRFHRPDLAPGEAAYAYLTADQ
ncbi:MAG: hypothetical protein ABI843_09170 [Dokdonella sp.]